MTVVLEGRVGQTLCREDIPVRVSIGSLAVLGLEKLRSEATPHTLYMLQYSDKGCLASCGFCTQSIVNNASKSMLSRVTWPRILLSSLIEALQYRRVFKRLCLQTIIKPFFFHEALCILERLSTLSTPVSLATTPVHKSLLAKAKLLGVDYLGVGLDASTPELFEKTGKPYTWSIYIKFIQQAIEVFGPRHVYVHLIAGLGENPRDLVNTMAHLYSIGARVALFNYTLLPGVRKYPGVDIHTYRVLQLARILLENNYNPFAYIDFSQKPPRIKKKLPLPEKEILNALLTSGCPDCNRPFYNESPRGPIYNYPNTNILEKHRENILRELTEIGAL